MSCEGCTRRSLLRGLAIGTAGALLAACGNDHGLPVSSDPDAGPPPGDATPTADAFVDPVTMCNGELCVDVGHESALQQVNGFLVVTSQSPVLRLIIVRTSETEFVTLSDICTHQGCAVRFTSSLNQLTCPCHGSRFDLTGTVTRGPAVKPLTVYPTVYDASSDVLTITLTA
jgi:Rieske Fe-S protein|nr:Rieske (2Fe-2S) protein [Kofleriaceae bacterium]